MPLSASIPKITPPHLPEILCRPRLLNLLEKNQDKKLILILGQAAQGKTTLAASYVKTLTTPSAWINLDKEDSEPFTLFHSIVQSLQHTLEGIDFSHFLSYPLGRMEIRAEIPLFREWTRSLFELISFPLQIVLDGLNRLSSDAPAFKFLQILVEDAPPNIHWLLLSREMPRNSLEFQDLKIKRDAFILTNEDLAFTPDGVKNFFKKIRRISITVGQLAKIYSATEGWIGGLILLAESIGRIPEPSRGKYISEELPERFQREVFQYPAREIFSSQSEKIQEFLIKSSILEIVETDFMKDFMGIEDSEEILRGFARRNLFVHSIYDERKGWLFRYHRLFRNFLKAKFESAIKNEARRSLFVRAGYLYEKRGEIENAVKYFLDGKAYSQAAFGIERLGMDLLRMGRKDELSRYLFALPEEIVQENPWLLFYLMMTRLFMGGKENVAALQRAHKLFRQKGDERGNPISLAELIDASIYTGVPLIPIQKLIEEGEAILQSSETSEYPYERAMLLYCLGLGHILADGDIRKGILACQNAYLIAKQLKDISLQAYALNFSVVGYDLVGEFSLANETCKKAEKKIEKIVNPGLRAVQLMVSTALANHQGDFERAQCLLEKLRSEIEQYGFVFISPWLCEISGYLSLCRGEFSEAEEIGKQYLSLSTALKNAFFKALALRLLGMIYLYQGDFKKAKEVTNQCIEALTKEAPSRCELQKAKLLLGLICFHLQDYRDAEGKLAEALKYFNGISSHISVAETHFVIALLKWNQGKKDEAAAHLQTGFKIAEEKKYDYFFFLGTKYLARACLLALELKVAGAMDYAVHLLSTRLFCEAAEELKKLANHPDAKIRQKARQVQRAIHHSRVPRLRIDTLWGRGTFFSI